MCQRQDTFAAIALEDILPRRSNMLPWVGVAENWAGGLLGTAVGMRLAPDRG
jgi:hypothetical protein